MKLMDLARRLGLLTQPGAGEKAKTLELTPEQLDAKRRADAAEEFRRKRNRAFRGIVTHQQALNLYGPTRLERTRERLVAGAVNRMTIEDERVRRRALEAVADVA